MVVNVRHWPLTLIFTVFVLHWFLLAHSGAELMLNTMYERAHRSERPDRERIGAHDHIALGAKAGSGEKR